MKIRDTIFGFFLALYDLIISKTSFFSVSGLQTLEEVRATGKPIILAGWHGQDHLLYGFFARFFDISNFVLIVNGDQYQQVLSTYVKVLGFKPIPINMRDDSMGAAKGVLQVVRELKRGKFTFIAPDGPAGPARQPKAGIEVIARRAGAVILPIAIHTNLAIQLNRWDRKYHPFPLARIRVGIGDPIYADTRADKSAHLSQVRFALNEVSDKIQTG
jgi:lysophospholipid acyltransferase (LPLAT)-like uncharacterized protein